MMVRRAGQATPDTWAILPDGSRVRVDGPSIVLDDEGIAEYCAERDREIEALLADIDAPEVGLQVCGGLAEDANDCKGDPARPADVALIQQARASIARTRRRKNDGVTDETPEDRKRRLARERKRRERAAKKAAAPAREDTIPGETPDVRKRRLARERKRRQRSRERDSVTEPRDPLA